MRAENWSISLCTGYGARDWRPPPSRERAGERGLMLAARPFYPSPARGEGVKTVWGMPLILRQGSKHQGCKRSSGKRLLHRRLGLVQAAEKPHGLRRGLGQMRWRWPQTLPRPGGIPAANVLALEGADGLPIDLCHPAGGWLLSPADVCHSAFVWWIGPSVGRVAGGLALWRTLRGGGCATGKGPRGAVFGSGRTFSFWSKRCIGSGATVATRAWPTAPGWLLPLAGVWRIGTIGQQQSLHWRN